MSPWFKRFLSILMIEIMVLTNPYMSFILFGFALVCAYGLILLGAHWIIAGLVCVAAMLGGVFIFIWFFMSKARSLG